MTSIYVGLRLWLELSDSIKRLKLLGMPETGRAATLAVTQPGSLREEYRNLCRTMNELESYHCRNLELAWVQGRGGQYGEMTTDDEHFIRWNNISFAETTSTFETDETNRLDGLLRDFINASVHSGSCFFSMVPAKQTRES